MTYYESSQELYITWTRALQELEDHGFDTFASVEEFRAECWNKYKTSNETIDAQHVLNWLGY